MLGVSWHRPRVFLRKAELAAIIAAATSKKGGKLENGAEAQRVSLAWYPPRLWNEHDLFGPRPAANDARAGAWTVLQRQAVSAGSSRRTKKQDLDAVESAHRHVAPAGCANNAGRWTREKSALRRTSRIP
jgi:hypothetical protein